MADDQAAERDRIARIVYDAMMRHLQPVDDACWSVLTRNPEHGEIISAAFAAADRILEARRG